MWRREVALPTRQAASTVRDDRVAALGWWAGRWHNYLTLHHLLASVVRVHSPPHQHLTTPDDQHTLALPRRFDRRTRYCTMM